MVSGVYNALFVCLLLNVKEVKTLAVNVLMCLHTYENSSKLLMQVECGCMF